jgi:triosephosphate isomerase
MKAKMRPSLLMANWKMNGSISSIRALLNAIQDGFLENFTSTCVVFPPTIYLSFVREMLTNTSIQWGGQNVYPKDSGAYTGETSAVMLKDYDCHYVLVGHSERRHLFHEDANFVAEKFHHVKEHDMIPVLCVGETLLERQEGRTQDVLASQIQAVYRHGRVDFENCVIAYEPVWAIGTGQTATPDEAQAAHAFIRELIAKQSLDVAETLPIVYGGSVNSHHAKDLFAMPDIDGGLVGGASLQAQQFLEIVTCINCC